MTLDFEVGDIITHSHAKYNSKYSRRYCWRVIRITQDDNWQMTVQHCGLDRSMANNIYTITYGQRKDFKII